MKITKIKMFLGTFTALVFGGFFTLVAVTTKKIYEGNLELFLCLMLIFFASFLGFLIGATNYKSSNKKDTS